MVGEKSPRGGLFFALLAGCAALCFMLGLWHARPTLYDNYVWLADAWLHGRNWITFPGDWIDAVPYHGRAYVVEAPTPAILMLPLVLIFGTDADQTLVDNLLGAVAVYGCCRFCVRVGVGRVATVAVTIFAFFGTSLFVCATRGDVWFLAHVSAFAFSMLALCELAGKRRAWLVAVWALAAAFSRYPLLLVVPMYAALLLWESRQRAKTFESYASVVLPVAVVSALYNRNRWGTFVDRGFSIWYRVMDSRYAQNPHPFSLANLPEQLRLYFATAPRLLGDAPWLVPPRFGFGIDVSSLPLVYALWAGWNARTAMLWVATFATAIPALTYYDTGGEQYGVRHALDFEPFLFALLALALARRPSWIVTCALFAFAALGIYLGLVFLLAPNLL
jgi:hypothetical protein